jgi:secreted PhoX family phosphatase
MTDSTRITIGYDDGDIDTNPSTGGQSLHTLIDQRYSRRAALLGGTRAAAFAVFGGAILAACGEDESKTAGPTITAGASGETSSGRIVTLTGSTSNTAATAQSAFSQVSGPPVALTQGATGTTFIAPSVAAATTLVFRYTATDTNGLTISTDTSVSITPATLGFAAVAKNKLDVVTVPEGYSVSVLYRLGDPIDAATPAYKNDGTDTNYATRAGDHGDALHWFGLAAAGSTRDDTSSTRGLLVMNHENINQRYLHVAGPTTPGGARPEAEALKEMECHGLSIVEVTRGTAGAWSYVQAGALNRRITPLTPMVINGPAKGSDLLKTAFSPTGVAGRGTINNCANGFTPWGTDLTCEENWAGYFRRNTGTDNPLRTTKDVTSMTRYAVGSANGTGNYSWSTVVPADATSTIYRRWDARVSGATATDDFRNEPYQFGWVVEIDPYDKSSVPRKRTALGRFNHEGCWPSNFVVGRKPAWYMGDDAQNEYLYKFVSATPWAEADASAADRLSIGDKYLDTGTLYVARFNADGSGSWSPLTFGSGPLTAGNATYPFADQADVVANARLAGDALGATRMDRPEWTAVNPVSGEVYLTLTNNSSRTTANTDAANPRAYLDPPNSSVSNRNGHIIRLRETGDTSEALGFAWDIYAFGAGADLDPVNINLSGLDATNDFSSPDGLWFGRPSNASGKVTPVLWIQTDDSAYTDVTNCMMLAAMPGSVNDGSVKTISNGGRSQATRVGKAPGTALRRFLVGPIEAEITGVDSTPDGRTLFVNIQHPGEDGGPANITSHWPDTQATGTAAATIRPRSATVVITKNDGGVVAL